MGMMKAILILVRKGLLVSYERSLPRRIGEVQQCHHLRENKRRMEEEHGHNQSAKESVASDLLSKL